MPKNYEFPVSVRSLGGGRTLTTPPAKPSLEVAVPPEFGGPDARVWSPEDLLVAAVASCYAVTLASVAERRGLSVRTLGVRGVGHVEKGPEGSAFTVVELRVAIEADETSWPAVEEAALLAEERCLVRRALDTPVHVELELRAAGTKRAAA
jgi:organic hydroperoxide reductase OsmC/OhrA